MGTATKGPRKQECIFRAPNSGGATGAVAVSKEEGHGGTNLFSLHESGQVLTRIIPYT